MIRNIIYLDEQKLISLLSQVLEGFTESFIKTSTTLEEENTSQKGPVASGRIVAEAIKTGQSTVEHRVLHDYAFSIFEKYLTDNDLLNLINEHTNSENVSSDKPFIKVSATAKIIDAEKIIHLLTNFNELGAAVAHTTKHDERKELLAELEQLKAQEKNNSEKQKIAEKIKVASSIESWAKDLGLWYDPEFISGLIMLIDYGFNKQLEIHQRTQGIIFSSLLKNESLRESKELIVRKYSRITERKIVVIGTITQTNIPIADSTKADEINHLKEAVINMIDHIADMEKAFSGKLSNEIVIDPIAVYVEL